MAREIVCLKCDTLKKMLARGMCKTCYQRWYYHSSPEVKKKTLDYQRKWVRQNRDKVNQYQRDYMKRTGYYKTWKTLYDEKNKFLKSIPPEMLLKIVREENGN